ncbi:baeRF11 domain-containing protein [Gordonia rhizosphera]|uniref:Uncharacterized protein n=1 Tax=Gordonia rhizosphera NBRC 16068 TaxID=1108045 RepID=K6W9N9_9ACTN|nr:hypothetical protein [Gordonia rhizosphera]GAB90476.1 hypothetical protein GORHZ_104_00050 [Gordonia rhizosphera NBRC 16068]
MARFALPTLDDLRALGTPHENAISIYAQTSPAPDERDASHLTAKSAFDRAIRHLRESGIRHGTETALRDRWESVANDESWSRLSHSLAIFIADDLTEMFVLPNRLENELQVGTFFDVRQLVRPVTTPQTAFALTLSTNGWNLWHATPTTVAAPMELSGTYGADAVEASNHPTLRDRDHVGRLAGGEGKKVLLEAYSKRVAEAVKSELAPVDPNAERPLFLFATDPLLDLYPAADHLRQIIPVPGGPDDLRADEIDAAIRRELTAINARNNNARVDRIADGMSRGLVATELADISHAASAGAVSTLIYNVTHDIKGTIDDGSGDITYADDGYDLLSRIAVTVLDHGGEAIAVRPDEITALIWNDTAVAGLRFPVT